MSEDARLRYLLARELDGEISALEAEELRRGLVASPSLRRERAAWSRVTEVIGAEGPGSGSLSLPRIEQGVLRALRGAPPAPARSAPRRLRGLAVALGAALLLPQASSLPARLGAPGPGQAASDEMSLERQGVLAASKQKPSPYDETERAAPPRPSAPPPVWVEVEATVGSERREVGPLAPTDPGGEPASRWLVAVAVGGAARGGPNSAGFSPRARAVSGVREARGSRSPKSDRPRRDSPNSAASGPSEIVTVTF